MNAFVEGGSEGEMVEETQRGGNKQGTERWRNIFWCTHRHKHNLGRRDTSSMGVLGRPNWHLLNASCLCSSVLSPFSKEATGVSHWEREKWWKPEDIIKKYNTFQTVAKQQVSFSTRSLKIASYRIKQKGFPELYWMMPFSRLLQ